MTPAGPDNAVTRTVKRARDRGGRPVSEAQVAVDLSMSSRPFDVAAEGDVTLRGMRCACGRVAFPFQAYGCERCGRADAIEPIDLAASGVLAAAVRVHLQPGGFPPPPFSVGAIRLDDGPMVRALLADAALAPGDRVVARWRDETGSDGHVAFTAAEGR